MTNHVIRRACALMMSLLLTLTLVCAASAESQKIVLSIAADGEEAALQLLIDPEGGLELGLHLSEADIVLDLTLISDGTVITLAADPILEGVYGIDLTRLPESLPASIFAPDSGSAFALDEESYQSFLGGYHLGFNAASAALVPENADAEHYDEYIQLISDCISAGLATSTTPATVPVNGEDFDVTALMASVTPEALSNTVRSFCEKLSGDEAMIATLQAAAAQAAADSTGIDPQQILALGNEIADEILSSEIGLSFSLFTDRASDMPVYADIRLGSSENAIGMEITNASAAKTVYFYTFNGENYSTAAGASLELSQMDDDGLDISLNLIQDDKYSFVSNLKADFSALTWAAAAESTEGSWSADGRLGTEGDDIFITLDTLNGEPVEGRLTLGSGNSVSVPAFTELMTMSETDFAELVNAFSEIF